MSHRIRHAMEEAEKPLLGGVVEVDETWVGGKKKYRKKDFWAQRTIVAGIIERGGMVMKRVRDRGRIALGRFIYTYAEPTTIFNDKHRAYEDIATARVNHSKEFAYRKGDMWVHTNSIESVWALLKRSIIGTFHTISKKHLNRYLEELAWKRKYRNDADLFELTLRQMVMARHLSYQELVE